MKLLIQEYYSHCLKADLPSGLKLIKKSKNTNLERKIISRFVDQNEKSRIPCEDKYVKSVIQTYRRYYCNALLYPKKVKVFEKALVVELKSLTIAEGIKVASKLSSDKLEVILKDEFKRRGFFSLFGTVSPFKSLMVWKKEASKTYTVELPEKKQKVKVVFMDQFIELSWLHYATFGKYYVGGWAKKDSLFCVKQAYKINGPIFKVHYLAHEAQHFSDYKYFPKLQQVDLEYRAKLAELALAKNPKKLILKLKNEAQKNAKIPHSFAAYQILKGIDNATSSIKLRDQASKLLVENTKLLKAKGARSVKSIF